MPNRKPQHLAASLARCLFVSAAFVASSAGFAQQPAPVAPDARPPAATSARSAAELVAALKQGGYVVYFRHAATDFSKNDEKMRDFDDCANQRNLTDAGRDQAKRIGASWRALGLPLGKVYASPFCRTRETAVASRSSAAAELGFSAWIS